jgi:hypothetical protein
VFSGTYNCSYWNFLKNGYKLDFFGTLTLVLLCHSTMGMLFRVSGSQIMTQTCFLVWVENLHLVLLYFLFGMDTRKKSSQDLHIHGGNCEISYELTLCSKGIVYSGKVLQMRYDTLPLQDTTLDHLCPRSNFYFYFFILFYFIP